MALTYCRSQYQMRAQSMMMTSCHQCFPLGFCNNSSLELYRIKLFKFLNFIGNKFSHVFTSIPLNTSNIHSNHMYNFLAIPPHKICTYLYCLHWWSLKKPFQSNHLIQNTHYISTIQMAFYYPFIFYCSLLWHSFNNSM